MLENSYHNSRQNTIKIQTLNNISEQWNDTTTLWEIMPPAPKTISNECKTDISKLEVFEIHEINLGEELRLK